MYFAWRSNCSKAVAAGEAFERGHLTKPLNSGLSLYLSSSCDNFVICFFLKDYIDFSIIRVNIIIEKLLSCYIYAVHSRLEIQFNI